MSILTVLLAMSNTDILNSGKDYRQVFGVSDVATMYDAAISTAGQVQQLCMPLAAIAMLIVGASQMTKWAMGETEFDWIYLGRFLLMALLLGSYREVIVQINSIIDYFGSAIGHSIGTYGSGHALTDKVNILLERTRNKQDYSIWTDGLNNILDWIISNCTQVIIIVARAVIYCVREVYMMFLMAVGPVAIVLSMFPILSGSAAHWFRMYLTAGLWSFTLTVLDMLLNSYLDGMLARNDDAGLIVMNVGIMLMYVSVPYMTSKFVGGVQSQTMQRMTGLALSIGGGTGKIAGGAGGVAGAAATPILAVGSKARHSFATGLGKLSGSIREKVAAGGFKGDGNPAGENIYSSGKNKIEKQSNDNI